jgi:general secretion pathway protein I
MKPSISDNRRRQIGKSNSKLAPAPIRFFSEPVSCSRFPVSCLPFSRHRRGFTLLEVMLALAVLGIGMVALLAITSRDIRASYRAKMLTVATGLAREKMYDLEEELLHTGFQDTGEHMEGDFSDDAQPRFKWSAEIERVYLPETGELADKAKQDKDKAAAAAPGPTDMANKDSLLNLAGGSSSGANAASMVQLYFPMIRPVLEAAIRRVTLTVSWQIGNDTETLQVACFFTDPKAVDRATGGLSGTPATTPATTPTTPPPAGGTPK